MDDISKVKLDYQAE